MDLEKRFRNSRNSHALRRNDEFWWCDDMEVVSTGPTDGRNGPFHVRALDLRAVVLQKIGPPRGREVIVLLFEPNEVLY